MKMRVLNLICYCICIVCIVIGVVFSLAIIWGNVDSELAWKGWLTIIVFFVASMMTLVVNQLAEKRQISK